MREHSPISKDLSLHISVQKRSTPDILQATSESKIDIIVFEENN